MTTQTTSQAEALRHIADVLDSLPGLPPLYVVCPSAGSFMILVSQHIGTDVERVAIVDRLAEALGVACSNRSDKTDDASYGTAYGVRPEVFTPVSMAAADAMTQ
jgi:hypothetical protein